MSGVSFQSYFVPAGKSSLFAIESSAFGAESFSTSTSLPSGVYLSASFSAGAVGSVIVTLTVVLSVVLSGYVTVTGTSNSPTVFPSGSLLGSSTVIVGAVLSAG